ncbi:MAG: hypothetical protein ACJASR_001420 [Psychroserpens sp.]|jgi:hypothetical protein
MKKLIFLFFIFLSGLVKSQELVNFYLEPAVQSEVVTLHTTVYRTQFSEFDSYSVSTINNVINVSLCYLNSSGLAITYDQQYFEINLPTGFNSYILNIEIFGDNDALPPCAQINLIDTGTLNFDYPYNPVQKINIPDNVFEDYLEGQGFGDDLINNDLVYIHRIENMTHLFLDDQFIPLSGDIEEMSGLESFQALKDLRVSRNAITNLDVSSNILLERLICYDNPLSQLNITSNLNLQLLWTENTSLTSLDITNNINLRDLTCYSNLLPTIDVSQNVNLLSLNCGSNQLVNLNVQNNILLETLSFSSNQISFIDLSNNTNLKDISFRNNSFTTIDLSNLVLLQSIDGKGNQLTEIDLVNLSDLKDIDFRENQLSTLDLSANSMLEAVVLISNNLSSLNLQNGNNENITVLISILNPNLFCIDVDDSSQTPYPGWGVDSQTIFSEDCSLNIIDIESITSISIYPNPVIDVLKINSQDGLRIKSLKLYDYLGRLVAQKLKDLNLIDASHVQSGVFFLRIETDNGVLFKKLIKE